MNTSHRSAMLRNMVTSLLAEERIETTSARAKELRRLADRMIVLAKRGDLHARRQAAAVIRDGKVVKKLFEEIAPRCQSQSGFTRMVLTRQRAGDAAQMALVELVSAGAKEPKKKKAKKEKAEKS
jgi:large subunit ribosomal protein L17